MRLPNGQPPTTNYALFVLLKENINVVYYSFNSVEFCYVPVEQDFLAADFDDSGHHIVGGEWY